MHVKFKLGSDNVEITSVNEKDFSRNLDKIFGNRRTGLEAP